MDPLEYFAIVLGKVQESCTPELPVETEKESDD